MILIKLLAGLLKALNGDVHPAQIAGGVWLGCMLGFSPFGAHTVIILVLLLVFRINMGSALVFWGITKLIAALTTSLFIAPFGQWLLRPESGTRALVLRVLETPVLGLADLENHAIVGGMSLGFFIGLALFFPTMGFITFYRKHVSEGFRNNKKLKWLSRNWLFRIFKRLLEGVSS